MALTERNGTILFATALAGLPVLIHLTSLIVG